MMASMEVQWTTVKCLSSEVFRLLHLHLQPIVGRQRLLCRQLTIQERERSGGAWGLAFCDESLRCAERSLELSGRGGKPELDN